MNTTFKTIAALLLSCSVAGAAQYWVATNGLDTNPGTQASPWLTIGHAASIANTNDTVFVTAGNYYENVTPAHSGSQGTNITFVGQGGPITCSFNLATLNNWRIIGFHFAMTNVSQTYVNGCINIRGSTNIQILDNWFDHIYSNHDTINVQTSFTAVSGAYSIVIRSNFFDHPGLAPWLTNGNWFPHNTFLGYGVTNVLFEYNKVQTAVNMIYLIGLSNVVRNNYFFDVQQSYFGTNLPHIDTVQTSGDGIGPVCGSNTYGSSYHNLIENNVTISNTTIGGSKFVIAQEPATNASIQAVSDYIIRKNVTFYIGSYIYMFDDAFNMRTYNNTFAYATVTATNSPVGTGQYCIECSTNYKGTGAIVPTNNVAINTIFYSVDGATAGTIICKGGGTTISNGPVCYDIFANNHSYLSGPSIYQTLGGDIIGQDPQFVNISGGSDLHLTGTSPGVAGSRPQTTTTASGSSTTIVPVADAGFFTDGWGMQWVNGDVVDVGTNGGVMIAGIDYSSNTLTLGSPITFNNGDGVFLDGTQDIGAYKYDPAGYSYGITLTAPLNLAYTPGTTALTASVTNPSKVRIVRFYVDGLEVANAPPAPVVSVNAVISGTNNVVQARAYALYADTNLVAMDSVTVNPPTVAPPSNLRYAQ